MEQNHQTYDVFSDTADIGTSFTLGGIEGRPVTVRPLDAGDRDELLRLFLRLSPESRRRRFLGPKEELSERELDVLADVDHISDEALVAVDVRDGSIIGVARYAGFQNTPGVADVAIAVADEFQGLGVGTVLASCLMQRARANRVDALVATTLWENRPARALMRRLGFVARASHGDQIELELRCFGSTGSAPAR
jgi:RimJ/RimL family protein N-acetyltransferase